MLKKWMSVLTTFCMLFALAQPFAMAEGNETLQVGSAQVAVGSTEEIPITIEMKNNPGVITLSFNVSFDSNLELVSVKGNSDLFAKDNTRSDNFTSPFPISLGDFGATANVEGDGVATTMTFKLKSGASAGDYAISIDADSQDNYNLDVDNVEFNCVAGKITVTPGEEETVNVAFDADGGAPVPDTQTFTKGGTATEPTAPTKGTDTFDGWYNGDTKWNFADAVNADMTLKAKWSPVVEEVTVTFDADGGAPAPAEQKFTKGGTATEPAAPTKGTDTFDGWYNGDAKWNFADAVNADMTLKAKWTTPDPVTVTVKFDADGGAPAPAEQKFTKGGTATEPATPTKDGFDFDGWYNGDVKWNFADAVNANMTLKAKWTSTPDPNSDCSTAAVYGVFAPELWTIRHYRDEVLGLTWYGRLFIKAYYAASPVVAKVINSNDWVKNYFRVRLDKVVEANKDLGSTPYQDLEW